MEKTISYTILTKTIINILLLLQCNICTGQDIDIRLLRHINTPRSTGFTNLMKTASNSAYVVSTAVPLTQLVAGYAKHDSTLIVQGLQTAAALGVNLFLTFGMKYAVNRRRPYQDYADIIPYQNDTDPSFPSSHTSFCFTIATTLSIEYKRWYVVVPAYAWATTVGYSRLYLGMHYPSDVLAGAITGSASAWLSYKGTAWLQHHHKLKGRLLK